MQFWMQPRSFPLEIVVVFIVVQLVNIYIDIYKNIYNTVVFDVVLPSMDMNTQTREFYKAVYKIIIPLPVQQKRNNF